MEDSFKAGAEQATSYPDVLNIGEYLFPMLYIYYYGDEGLKRNVGNMDKFKTGLSAGIQNLTLSSAGDEVHVEATRQFMDNVVKYHKMLTSAAAKNKMWLWEMNNAVSRIMEKYKVRLPQIRGNYYEGNKRKGTSYTPILDPSDPKNLFNMMESLRLLYENDILTPDFNLGTRAISLYTGEYSAAKHDLTNREKQLSRLIGMPSVGQFTLNTRNLRPMFGRTFSGTDMKIVATLNDTVTMVKNMTSFSWSVHRAKSSGRPLGRPGPRGRASGSRTIAGTMIFAAADHEPLLDIIPEDAPTRRLDSMGWNKVPYRKVFMPDQLPPFDVMVIMNNEYGTSAITTIYGVEIVDYGAQLSVDNLINEHVYQYTASGMDPLVEAYPDENGYFDPYGLLQGGYSEMWFRKEAAMEGLLHSDYEQQYITMLRMANETETYKGFGNGSNDTKNYS